MPNPKKIKPEDALAAVQQNGYAIQCIHNPSEAIRLAAVQQNGYAIRFLLDDNMHDICATYLALNP